MQTRSIPSVTLYIRVTDEKGNRRYDRSQMFVIGASNGLPNTFTQSAMIAYKRYLYRGW